MTHSSLRAMVSAARRREVLFYQGVRASSPNATVIRAHRDLLHSAPYAEPLQRTRIEKGWTLFSLLDEGESVSYAWARNSVRQWIAELSCAVDAPSSALWIIDCITPPEHRGRGYYPRLIRSLCDLSEGEDRLIYCEAGNAASMRGIQKAGFQPIGSVRARWGRLTASAGFPLEIVA